MESGSTSLPNPFVSIWTSPRRTIRAWIDSASPELVLGLAAVAGISDALERASSKSLGDHASLPVLLGLTVVVGAISGLMTLYVLGFLVAWTGR